MALATVPRGDGLALVHIGAPSKKDPVVSDGYGLKLMPSTIMWHMRTDLPARIGFAHHWAETQAHHCAASGVKSGPLVHCAAEHVTSCTGAH